MKGGYSIGKILSLVIFLSICAVGLAACGGDDGPTPGSLAITSTELPEGVVNRSYSGSVSGSGGALPYTWAVSPALPANLSLDKATGAITGTPTTLGTTTHTFTLTDASAPSQTVEQFVSLTIEPPLAITTTSLPDGSIGGAYNQPVRIVGGSGALSFSIVQPGTGTLPQNLSLNSSTGVISGIPIAPAGNFPFTVRVVDTAGQEDTQALSIRINPSNPPQITTTSLPGGTIGRPYSQRLQASGGIGALAWSVSAGSLPAGLLLDQAGNISGTPTTAGTANVTVRATDSLGQTDTQALSITISTLEITTTSLPAAKEGEVYSATLQSSAIQPVIWSVTPPLPDTLILNPLTGEISGIPAATTQGTYALTFTAQDPTTTASKQLDLIILPQ